MKFKVNVALDPIAAAAVPFVELGGSPTNTRMVLGYLEVLADALLDRYGEELDEDYKNDNRVAGLRLLVRDMYAPPPFSQSSPPAADAA